MKKLLFLMLTLSLLLCLMACKTKMPYDLTGTESVEIYAYDSSSADPFAKIIVDGKDDVSSLVDNFNSLQLKKLDHTEPSILGYEFWFRDAAGSELAYISLPYGPWPWVVVNGTAYADVKKEIDLEFLARLVDITVTTGPKNE